MKRKSGKRKDGTDGKAALVVLTILLLALFLSSFPPCAGEETTKGWLHSNFEDNIALSYSPKNPNASEPVLVYIESLDAVPIKNAYLRITVSQRSGYNFTGDIAFYALNETAMQATIAPNYESGSQVSFYVWAMDYDYNTTTSQTYYYVIGGKVNERWRYPTFEENVELTYNPQEPKAGQKVQVLISSKDPNVTITGANLLVRFKVREQAEQSGGFVFARINSTSMVAEIPGYPIGTNLTFWVEAWDYKISVLTSSECSYLIKSFGYEVYGIGELPQVLDYAGGGAFLIISVIVIFHFLKTVEVRRRRHEQSASPEEPKKGSEAKREAPPPPPPNGGGA